MLPAVRTDRVHTPNGTEVPTADEISPIPLPDSPTRQLHSSASVTALARQEAQYVPPLAINKNRRRPETSPEFASKSLPSMAPVTLSPYDEEQRLRREVTQLRKRCKELEKAGTMPPRDLQVAALQEGHRKQLEEMERRAAELTAAEMKRIRARSDAKVLKLEKALEFANADRQSLHKQLQSLKAAAPLSVPQPTSASSPPADMQIHARGSSTTVSAPSANGKTADTEPLRDLADVETISSLNATRAELMEQRAELEASNSVLHTTCAELRAEVARLTEERDQGASELQMAADREALLLDEVAKGKGSAQRLLEKQKATLVERAADQALQLEKKLAALQGAADEREALVQQQARQDRIEMLRRQVMRRMMNHEITRGWTCWLDYVQERAYCMGHLHEVGRRLRSPSLTAAFDAWRDDTDDAKQAARAAAMAREKRSLEGTLRQTRFELGQLAKVKLAHEDEIAALQKQVAEMSEELKDKGAMLVGAAGAKRELDELRELYAMALKDVEEAEGRAAAAEGEEASQRAQSEALLSKLLEEQRATFEIERATLKAALEQQTEQQEREARVATLRKAAARRIQHRDTSRGFSAWIEHWEARRYATGVLRRVASKLQVRGVAAALTVWARRWEATLQARREASMGDAILDKEGAMAVLQAELASAKAELAAALAQREGLRAKLDDALGGEVVDVEGLLEAQAQAAKEERVEHLRRQMARRLLSQDVLRGWTAWHEAWQAAVYAKERLRHIAQHWHSGEVAAVFRFWTTETVTARIEAKLGTSAATAAQLRAEITRLQDENARAAEALTLQMGQHEEALKRALERQLVELTGSAEERAALVQEQEKAQRVELLRRQMGRRLMYADLTSGWAAWRELWEAKTYAREKLRHVANRLRTPAVAFVFELMRAESQSAKERQHQAKLLEARRREAGLQSEYTSLNDELGRMRAAYEQQLLAKEDEKQRALERQRLELTGTADQLLALQEEKDKEGRVELMRRQMARRMLHADLASGWAAWLELWEARTHAMSSLRAAGSRLKAPSLSTSFGLWLDDMAEAKQRAALAQLEAQSNSLEAQLRRARFDMGQLGMVKTAQDDELHALRERVDELTQDAGAKGAKLAELHTLPREMERLREALHAAETAAREAVGRREEAELDVARQVAENKDLLEKLLAEQRQKLLGESRQLRDQLSSATEQLHTRDAEARRMEEELERIRRDHKDDVSRLQKEIERLTAPPPPKKERRPKGGLSNLDLDEGPDAKPIAEQLAEALRSNSTRVLDLFRSWDADGDGEVSRAEFHKAMPALGLEVPKKAIDDLFSTWDKDGGGSLGYAELSKILKESKRPAAGAKTGAPALGSAVTVAAAAAKLSKKS